MQTIAYRFIQVNQIRLHVALAGPADGPPVILLHGFPDASFGWDKQIVALAEAGFYVIAPDQRGYNLSDKPKGVANYTVGFLVADILALADALGLPRFHLAGHDWGAMVGWTLADRHPERVMRLAILNVPHPRMMRQFLKENREQRGRSWYMFFFRLPVVPELVLRLNRWQALARAMCQGFSETELNRFRAAWAQPGAMTAMLNWYRGLFQRSGAEAPFRKIQMPTLIIWGKKDPHLMWQMAPGSLALCEEGRLEFLEDATHWVHQDQPEAVNRLLIEHFLIAD